MLTFLVDFSEWYGCVIGVQRDLAEVALALALSGMLLIAATRSSIQDRDGPSCVLAAPLIFLH